MVIKERQTEIGGNMPDLGQYLVISHGGGHVCEVQGEVGHEQVLTHSCHLGTNQIGRQTV